MSFIVIIESRLSGSAAGHAEVNSDPSATIDSLIVAFCTEKGIRQSRQFVLRNENDEVLDSTRTLESYGVADGDTLHLTRPKEDMFGFHNWYVMAAVAFFISFIGFVGVNVVYSYNGNIPEGYGIVFDAGSTHTAMVVYSWGGAKLNNTGTPNQIHVCNMYGIAGYENKDKLNEALKNCLNEGKSFIPGGKVGTTYLYLGATGGMRLLSIKNQTAADEIMKSIDETFSTSGFYYVRGMASIISGITEGADAWTTTNYAENVLPSSIHGTHSMGTLDLGGASTQFAVVVKPPTNMTSNITVDSLTLYGKTHNVSVNSYLCYGQVQAFNRHLAQLTEGWKDSEKPIPDPCLPRGYNCTKSLNEIFYSPCTLMDKSLWPTFNLTKNVTFVGSSNYDKCLPLVVNHFNESACKNHYKYEQCFDREDLGSLRKPFIAISGFYELVHVLNLTQPNLTEFTTAVQALCNSNWTEAQYFQKHLFGSVTSLAQWYCFDGTYVSQLLIAGYNFNESTWADFLTFQNTMNNVDLGWSMGFMINATNEIAAEIPKIYITLTTFVFMIIIFSVFLFISAAFGIHAWRRSRRPPAYQRLYTNIREIEDNVHVD